MTKCNHKSCNLQTVAVLIDGCFTQSDYCNQHIACHTSPAPAHGAQRQLLQWAKLVNDMSAVETDILDILGTMYNQLMTATSTADILCWSTLVAHGTLPQNSTVADAIDYYNSLPHECTTCIHQPTCPALIINQ